MRNEFAKQLYKLMQENDKVFFITGDLGYGLFDDIKRDFPSRFINTGAAEQAMMCVGVGLALEGKIPIVYSITPFLLFRPYEIIRNYVNHESIPVILVGSGRFDDYTNDGYSHSAMDQLRIHSFLNIVKLYDETHFDLKEIAESGLPYYLNLKR